MNLLKVRNIESCIGVVGCGESVVNLTSSGRPTLILAYSWARPAILVADKARG